MYFKNPNRWSYEHCSCYHMSRCWLMERMGFKKDLHVISQVKWYKFLVQSQHKIRKESSDWVAVCSSEQKTHCCRVNVVTMMFQSSQGHQQCLTVELCWVRSHDNRRSFKIEKCGSPHCLSLFEDHFGYSRIFVFSNASGSLCQFLQSQMSSVAASTI